MNNAIINFSSNWNNKLDCTFFTTFRLHNPLKYVVDNEYEVQLKGMPLFVAKIVTKRTLAGKNINPYIAGLDTGYSVKSFKEILTKMYKSLDVETTLFDFILLQKVNHI